MRQLASRAPIALPLLAALSCAPAVMRPTAAALRTAPHDTAISRHVIVISVDGLRPDAIAPARARTIGRLMREGSHTLAAQTIMPSKTLPSHTSMLTGVEPSVHGITWNSDLSGERGVVRVPTVFAIARANGFRTAAFFGKRKFRHPEQPETLDHVYHQRAPRWNPFSTATAVSFEDHVEEYLAGSSPNVLFVHLKDPDLAGHAHGWMSAEYSRAVRVADDAVDDVLEEADVSFGAGNYTVILTADHGGHERTHGTADPLDTTIPWVAWGRGVREGLTLSHGVRTTDTAATVLWLLGVEVPSGWTGRPVMEAFEQ